MAAGSATAAEHDHGQPKNSGGGNNPPPPPKRSPERQSAFDELKSVLASWGLSSLYSYAVKYLRQGFTADQVQIELEQTKEYQQRFSGNELRQKAGLSTLSPAQYIALEEQYRQIANQYGLGSNFYAHDSLAKLIGGDVSPAEYQTRAQIALQTFKQAPQEYRDYWAKYGFTPGDAVSAIMDPSNSSLADLQLKAQAVQIGGTAAQQGINVGGNRAIQFAENGVSLDQARQAYQRIAQMGATDSSIAKRFGLTFNQADEENDLLLNQADASRKRNLLYTEEAAQFSGRGGASANALAPSANY